MIQPELRRVRDYLEQQKLRSPEGQALLDAICAYLRERAAIEDWHREKARGEARA